MDDLILRSLQGETSEIEERRIAVWRRADPANERAYRRARRVWGLGEALADDLDHTRIPTIDELARDRRPRSRPAAPPSAQRGTWRRRVLIPAAAMIGLLVGYAVLRTPAESPLGVGEYATNPGETRTVTLGDGTIVHLAPDTRLRLMRSANREVWLEGHAYFAVERSQDPQPFRIRTAAGDAVVLGTRFDLQASEDRMRLLVVEGTVAVDARGHTVEVASNELARVAGSGELVHERVDPDELERELGWMSGVLIFAATPLHVVARELAQRYGVPVQVEDSAFAQETVRGWFQGEELADVLVVICRVVEARCRMDENGVTIAP